MSDGIMDRTVCVKTDGDACKETVTIQIKNCSSFYVYKLQRLPDHLGCPAAYYFVSNDLCHAQQSLPVP
ncbi:hypothetical protein DPMN_135605 [Dreissena polymorpha]|uniref:Uncharacterized protein n=1 Tax=Dreissena polymorpha TaxID=45954 RepID=A0A9D4G286_DREPO|nr:hypothetical protein DPMN_135605 [Dreissena polymorpha]